MIMGVCMGKENGLTASTDLDPDGRFVSSSVDPAEATSVTPTPPRTPIIFVLGGPGSGKITHCDRVVQERQGVAHINMTDLIQQHVVGNGMGDFNQVPPSNLIEVLQMEMKMAVTSRCFLISGYPRSMRDVVEYQRKLVRVDGVILLNWHTRILEKQIEYGSQLGDTVLQLARMELKNYSKHVLAVAAYYDQMKRLKVVDGERQPTDVYDDFVLAVDAILKQPAEIPTAMDIPIAANVPIPSKAIHKNDVPIAPINKPSSKPNIVWIIGGPGSNKSLLSSTSVRQHQQQNWEWISIGQELRNLVDQNKNKNMQMPLDQINEIKNNLSNGELVSNDVVVHIIRHIVESSNKPFFVIDGFPRNYLQVKLFQKEMGAMPQPSCILVDCSEVELGRSLGQRANNNLNRMDDQSLTAVRKRLELYRTVTLPTLKMLDDQQRLHIIDGDIEDKTRIVEEFNQTIVNIVGGLKTKLNIPAQNDNRKPSTDTIDGMYREVEE